MAFPKHQAIALLARSQELGRLAHAYLVTGPRGSGKREVAMSLVACANGWTDIQSVASHPDVHIVEPESKSRRILIEQTRDLEAQLRMRPFAAKVKAGLIFDADRLQSNAANAFLKTLEEPPGTSIVVLVAEQAGALLDTIVSRCIEIPLKLEERVPLTSRQRQLAQAIAAYWAKANRGLPGVFLLVRAFSSLLAEAKEEIRDSFEDVFKKEEKTYRETTESKSWLEDREKHFAALTESRYVGERQALVGVLVQWWGDVARHQAGATAFDLEEFEAATLKLSTEMETPDVLARLTEIERLNENLGRPGVQEQLAIEVAFLRSFGD